MSFAKTESGRAALRNRAAGLTTLERQILIVSNGHRDEHDLSILMCKSVYDEIDRLIALGFLARTDSLVHADFSQTGTLLSPLPSSGSSKQRRATDSAQAPTITRRSLAGAKMYLMGVLSLQRSPEAVGLAVDIHSADNHDDFLDRAADCVHVLTELNGSSYVRRVARKLGSVMPESHLPEFVELLRARALPEVVGAFMDEAMRGGQAMPAIAVGAAATR